MSIDEDRLRLLKLKRERMAISSQKPTNGPTLEIPTGQMQTGQVLPPEPLQQPVQIPQGLSLGNVLEPSAAIVTGAVTEPVAGLAGLASLPFAGEGAGDVVKRVRESTTIPLSSEGRQGMETLGDFVRPGIDLLTGAENFLGEKGFEGAGPVGGALAKTIPTAVLMATGPLLKHTGKVLEKSGRAAVKASRGKTIKELILPERTKKVAIDETARTIEKGRGVFKREEVLLSPREKVLAFQVSKVPGVGKGSMQGNLNKIRTHNRELGNKLALKIEKADVQVPHVVAAFDIDDAVKAVIEKNPIIPVGADGKNAMLTRFAEQAKKILSEQPQTAKGLLDARKAFDKFAETQRSNVFSTDLDPVMKLATFSIRDAMNSRIATAIPRFKVELAKQSALFEATANIAPKAAAQASSAVGRVWGKSAEVFGTRNKIMQGLAVAGGTSVLGAATQFAPAISMTVGIGGAVYLGGKLLTRAQSRMVLGRMAALAGQAIGATKSKKAILQLKADRAMILQTIKYQQQESEQ